MNGMDQELIQAARENNVPEARRLLRAGADTEVHGFDDLRPLHWACLQGHLAVIIELLEHGADTEAKGNDDWRPLHLACIKGHLAVVIELLSRGANIEAKNSQGNTPLHMAILGGVVEMVQALLRRGANILAPNYYGTRPIDSAVRDGNSAVAKYSLQHFYATIRRLPLHEFLQDLTWIGNPYMRAGAPPLREALHRNMLRADDVVEIIEYLVGQNPEFPSSRDRDGSLPLHVACRRGASFTIVQSLVNLYKASVKCLTPQGDLPLFLACEIPEPSLDTIFILVKLYPDLVHR
jgi:ankyrin repeat protein